MPKKKKSSTEPAGPSDQRAAEAAKNADRRSVEKEERKSEEREAVGRMPEEVQSLAERTFASIDKLFSMFEDVKSTKLTKSDRATLESGLKEVRDNAVRMCLDHTRMSGKLDSAREIADGFRKDAKAVTVQATKMQRSYAQVARVPPPERPANPEAKAVKTIRIMPKDGNAKCTTSKETRAQLEEVVIPRTTKLQINKIRSVGKNGLLVETSSDKAVAALLGNEKIDAVGLKAEETKRKEPRVIVYDVDKTIAKENLVEYLFDQNLEEMLPALSREEAIKSIRPVFRTGPKKGDIAHWVMEVPSKIRSALVAAKRVYLGWSACKVLDYVVATRCFKCQAYGHVGKHCRTKELTCGHCAKKGHEFKDCPNKKQSPTCINCKRFKKPHNHSVKDVDCPAYKHAKDLLIKNTNYGSS